MEKLTFRPNLVDENPEDIMLKMAREESIYHPLMCIMGLLTECDPLLPKITHLSMSFLSILVARRPASTLSLFNAGTMYHAVYNYNMHLFRRLHNCLVEELFAVVVARQRFKGTPACHSGAISKCSSVIILSWAME